MDRDVEEKAKIVASLNEVETAIDELETVLLLIFPKSSSIAENEYSIEDAATHVQSTIVKYVKRMELEYNSSSILYQNFSIFK
jgi:hypothetical protein